MLTGAQSDPEMQGTQSSVHEFTSIHPAQPQDWQDVWLTARQLLQSPLCTEHLPCITSVLHPGDKVTHRAQLVPAFKRLPRDEPRKCLLNGLVDL